MSYLGKLNNRNEFPLLINEMELKVGAEIGVQTGGFSYHILNNTNLFMYLVDPWVWISGYDDVSNVENKIQEQRLQITRDTLSSFVNRYKILRMFSINAVQEFQDNFLDFIYIDANHDYKHVLEDLNAWYPKIRPGGLISGHDYLDSGLNFGVRSAVLDFTRDKQLVVYNTWEDWPSWYIIK
jgi:hypothetical protein